MGLDCFVANNYRNCLFNQCDKAVVYYYTTLFSSTHAQIGTQKDVLTNTAKSLEAESRSNFSEAIIKSKQKGWPLEYKSKDNQTSSLIGIDKFGLPLFVKPSMAGSSVGVSKVVNADQLSDAILEALRFDTKALIEPAG